MILTDKLRRSGRSLLSAKTRTILTSFAIAVGAFALTLTLAASNGAQNYANQLIKNNFDPSELIVTADEGILKKTDITKPQVYDENFGSIVTASGATTQIKMLSDTDLRRLATVVGISSVRPNVSVNLQYLTRDGQKKYVGTLQAFNSYKKPDLLAGSIPAALPEDTIIIPEAYLSALGFDSGEQAIGKTVRLAVSKPVDRTTLVEALAKGDGSALTALPTTIEKIVTIAAVTKKPSTLVQPGTELYLYASDATVTALNDISTQGSANYHKYLTTFVKVADGTNKSKLNAAQEKIKSLGYGAQSVADTQKTLTQIITVLQGIVLVFGLIAVVASVFGVVNTMYISVLQRTREIGLMKALGMHKKDISSLFRYEAALIGFLGGILGSGVAVVLGVALNPALSKQLGLGNQNLLDFRFTQIGLLVLALVVTAILAGLLPARKAAQLDPIAALRTE